ncbi:MAG: acetyl-CoA carboxylase biotin carboxylase subunit [Candidatus Lambdaproteobacteria bacterium]|nr:acetyl-CoA carboxylase biotin carboxylase subunit [Candidatus Lambdaproteobacteria bacterium]
MIETLLIANRGEIAMRVQRTCREMGIRTVAVYSDADADTPLVREADLAVRLGPPAPAESYLDIEHILAIAVGNGVDAIHPGYGFLAENPAFSAACAQRGIVFVGPAPEVIRAMGDKAEAKHRMMAAGVSVVPGYSGDAQGLEDLAREAAEVGYPLLVKAVAGGGGRGIRLVEGPDGLADALQSAQREAQVAFGDARIMLEKYLRRPRHVEMQVMADRFGHTLHLCERECSVQRRHQKVVEETPSPALHPALRQAMGHAAVEAAKAIDYVGAGTVEFLLDQDGAFYFLEMNTRLQVEHPVTELTLGLDLVRMQIEIAEGQPLALQQTQIVPRGHAIECRVNAENPAKRFLPSAGRIDTFLVPQGPGLRVDTGFESGSQITPHYDSLVAKLVAWGPTRGEALRRMRRMLAGTRITGILTNIPFLQAVLEHEDFVSGDYATTLVEQHLQALTRVALSPALRLELLLAAAAMDGHAALAGGEPAVADHGAGAGPSQAHAARGHAAHAADRPWAPLRRAIQGAGDEARADITLLDRDERGARYRVLLEGIAHEIGWQPLAAGHALLDLGEVRLTVRWSGVGEARWLTLRGRHMRLTTKAEPAAAAPEATGAAAGSATRPTPKA